jgi:cytochrome c5
MGWAGLRFVLFAAALASAACAIAVACSPAPSTDAGPSCPLFSTTCPAAAPSWQSDVEPLVRSYCDRCHGDGGIGQPLFDDTSYAAVFKGRSTMATQLNQCWMPPYDASPPANMPTAEERQTILWWLACGAPDD